MIKRSFFLKPLSALTIAAAAMTCNGTALAADITGAGATFPYAVYTQWAEAYQTATRKQVNYQGIGSSGGVKQIKARTVDFAGTDAPLKESELASAGLVQVPTVMGGVTLVVNLPGIPSGKLRLDGTTAAEIFRGAISRWNAPAIAEQNPGLKLPDLAITLAHRSDGSGTTAAFADYLARQSPAFRSAVGVGTTVNWPANAVGGKGNPGVAANVQKIAGAIGYVDIADALKNRLSFVALKNKAGRYIVPSQEAVAAAASGANFRSQGMAPDLLDQPQESAWPITTATYVLAYAKGEHAEKQQGVVDFFTWSINHGQRMARDLGFVPLPEGVVKMVETELKRIR
ncbi:MAG TPA: phosphate ABC transporter substrate-binding protein PstS [Accumulibacter sp.]|nr:phosphate ABC transporter substrate-binding protein PstS [Accumulibacter sp.]HMW17236.1 phosphate ABC transporter substrate-binding protein PstS [Accumulibacter sp.]HNC19117.1 phosphate ABC transporter substrate-binding protein PstS [Accumulibacter sp.]HND80954.1 phosphate ABC transporter substrate-binding protein PstS [Accumulibacter sp.]HNE12670.1 phosphate ABC transporter substrate-binding protein PstS [Accumulibacter sp.]